MKIPNNCIIISIHAPRTGSDEWRPCWGSIIVISIHAPRTGSDGDCSYKMRLLLNISIHAPRTGSDYPVNRRQIATSTFQSTLPARGATAVDTISRCRQRISIHAPRTGSDIGYRRSQVIVTPFQSTLPARGATPRLCLFAFLCIFQSTLPARGATVASAEDAATLARISIHAPRTGSDPRK